jgi:hypothetical protein
MSTDHSLTPRISLSILKQLLSGRDGGDDGKNPKRPRGGRSFLPSCHSKENHKEDIKPSPMFRVQDRAGGSHVKTARFECSGQD